MDVKIRIIAFLMVVWFCAISTEAVVLVTNVIVAQREGTKLVDISYDVSSYATNRVSVSLVATYGTQTVSTVHATGDIGDGISTGIGKAIVWDGEADWDGNFSTNLCVTVSADEQCYPISRFVRYTFKLQNQKGDFIPRAEFWVRSPVKETANQIVDSIEADSSYELIEDSSGNQILHFVFMNFPPYGAKYVRIKANLHLSEDAVKVNLDTSQYLGASYYMEINNSEFQSLAPSFDPGDPVVVAGNIKNWVRNHVRYELHNNTLGALFALKYQYGDGTDMAYLFAALCRRAGIPARVLSGYRCTQNAILGAGREDYAEFFDGERWHLVDVNELGFPSNGSEYVSLCVATDTGALLHTYLWACSGDGFTAAMQY